MSSKNARMFAKIISCVHLLNDLFLWSLRSRVILQFSKRFILDLISNLVKETSYEELTDEIANSSLAKLEQVFTLSYLDSFYQPH